MKDNYNNLRDIIGEPDFEVNEETYIKRCEDLLQEMNSYIKELKIKMKNETIPAIFNSSLSLIMMEFQKEVLIKFMESLKYSTR